MKKRALVVCPGRGSYTKESLGYLKDGSGVLQDFLADLDQRRSAVGEPSIREMDAETKFQPALHTKGEHASPLIYACAYSDFLKISPQEFDIVGICGNSMGWYLTLVYSGVLDWGGGFHLIQTMGSMMKSGLIGGQVIYPIVDDAWRADPKKIAAVDEAIAEVNTEASAQVVISIRLGGYRVLAGSATGVASLLKKLPRSGDYPFQLINHGAFHSPLLRDISAKAFAEIPKDLFQKPTVPIVDGRGKIFYPQSANVDELYNYTLGQQVVDTYDFTKSVSVALKELAPDKVLLLGPGNSLGGVLGQILVQENWQGITSKEDFQALQKEDPFLVSMGLKA